MQLKCIECGVDLPESSHSARKYCSGKCKARWRKKNGPTGKVTSHVCRVCACEFPIKAGQHNKWLCSQECVRSSNAASARNFHERRPQQEAIYRARTREKKLPDSTMHRFYRKYPNAPKACESCGEKRVLEIAHKPGHERLGERRNLRNQAWPEKVWVLCPTCHRLLDRMNYTPEELGLACRPV